MFKIKITNL